MCLAADGGAFLPVIDGRQEQLHMGVPLASGLWPYRPGGFESQVQHPRQ